jgi:uncharacterized protein with LGFP repeats
MKKSIGIFFFILFATSNGLMAQNGKGKSLDIAKQKIIAKANKLNLKSYDNYTLNYQRLAENDDENYVYFSSFNNSTAAIFYRNDANEAFVIWGDIYNTYNKFLQGDFIKNKDGRVQSVNQKYFLGAPISDEFKTPNKNGVGQHFEGGSIYWSPATGSHEVHGAIKDKWAAMGWENSFLGFPVTDETITPDGYGRYNFFEGGAIYYHPNLGTYAIPRIIAEVWKKEGWEKGTLGYPTSDEIIKNNNSVQYFEFGAVISTKGGSYKVIYNSLRSKNGLYTKWRQTGGIDSYLGDLVAPNKNYPKTFRYHFAEFQNGFIYENPTINENPAFVIKKGPFFDYYAKQKWETGALGFPMSDEKIKKDGTLFQNFDHGTVFYSKSLGAFEQKL